MSDVEKFYYAISEKFNSTTKWHELPPQAQMQFVQALNIILQIVTPK
jgi:hypothetical protein